jgi:hypothetical protein
MAAGRPLPTIAKVVRMGISAIADMAERCDHFE